MDNTELTKDQAEATDQTFEYDEDLSPEELEALYDQSLKTVQEGEVARGRIIAVEKDYVVVDIGYKSEGQIDIREFTDPDGNVNAEVGQEIDVLLEWTEDEDGTIILSKEKAAKIKVWDEISKVYANNGVIRGVVVGRVKGGMSVDIGVPAFLPGSQVDLRPVRNLDSLINQTLDFRILKFNKKRSNIVLSRRVLLEEERESKKSETLKVLEENAVMRGVVKNITDYGVFVDLGGIDGLLHITDMSWGRVGHPSDMFHIGDEITVKVLNFDRDRERVSLGLKQLKDDPWNNAAENFAVGTKVRGKVVSLADYGAFVEVDEGIEGLIHVSEMSWTRKVRHPSKIVNVGDEVEAVVLSLNPESKRISLGMKQVEPNPWDLIAEKYPVGTTIEGRVKNVTDFGLFIGIDEGIDGLVHVSDISWSKRIKHPGEIYKKGDEVRAVVLNIDRENERFSLGIKQLEGDPWDRVPESYAQGTKVSGVVTNVTDFGVFVELEEGVEGLIHVSEISGDKIKTPVGMFEIGDTITAKVTSISRKDRKIGLSMRRLDEEPRSTYSEYMNNTQSATSNLGELLKEGLAQKEAENQE
ncbi:ribosomal protein S1 [Desulfarculus baarsii DSM 2075]|uniref:Small ribosomal subunit protein bS1 n=1 Tax=Desulfarculus baarsii (strain ATCC 33931 / DSM 2075 / LMG 7858 / VKM B-1802 / 2st14) TaxID=644282 RepID=E1QKH5_DESB2|nr:30S ribosomal protein S1 [Desulfarculus baarsii]ADK86068.1 ribosomal protein S1 [Desulfarculus baarsii DSM 2075]